MKPVKWETVKLRAQREVNLSVCGRAPAFSLLRGVEEGSFDWRGNLGKLQKKVWEIIAKWDIRRVGKLHDLFPSCLSKDCRYRAELLDDGEWWIIE